MLNLWKPLTLRFNVGKALWAMFFLSVFILPKPAEAGLADLASKISGNSSQGKIVLVFVDLSGSVKAEEWRTYSETYKSLIDTLKAGDRLVLSAITDRKLTDFQPFSDKKLPKTGVKLNDKEKAKEVTKEMLADWESIKQTKPSASTNILDMFNIAQQFFEHDSDRKERWIVVLSDMVEENKNVNFMKTTLTPENISAIISKRKSQNLLPELTGVKVFVAGAGLSSNSSKMNGVSDAEMYMRVKQFWFSYLKQVGADISDNSYGKIAFKEFK